MSYEIAFEMAVSSVRFGPGVTREVGMDLADMRVRHALVITDPVVNALRPVQVVLESLHAANIRRQMWLDLLPLIVAQPEQIGPHPLLRRESSAQANQQPIQATMLLLGLGSNC